MTTGRELRPPERGLPSLNRARAERRRSLVVGRVRIYGGSPQFWLWTGVLFATFAIIYWKVAEGQLESQKSAVMATQRAVAEALGPKIIPFRDKLEGWIGELSADPMEPYVASGAALEQIRTAPGVYLRLRLENARSVETIRKAAQGSLHDGFTGCLFVREEKRSGPPCRSPGDCEPGLLCNERSVCAPPAQPYNLRLAYRALRVLSPDWTDELHAASSDLAVRAFELDLDAVARTDVPIAIDLLARARYFTVVLDEDPSGGVPPPVDVDGGRPESVEERIQRTAHLARVGIWDIEREEPILRLRTEAHGEFVAVGDRVVSNPAIVHAQRRQVNNCALALGVKEALAKVQAPAADGTSPPPVSEVFP